MKPIAYCTTLPTFEPGVREEDQDSKHEVSASPLNLTPLSPAPRPADVM